MKKFTWIIIVIVIIGFIVLGILRTRQKEDVESISRIQQKEGVPVLAVKVELGKVVDSRSYYGTIRSAEQTMVSAKLMERIDRILVEPGDRVEKDQVLVQFDTTASQAGVVQLRLAMENAQKDVERMQALFDQGAISRQTLDQVTLAYNVAKENYLSARRSVNMLAPNSGKVSLINFSEGDLVMPGDLVLSIVNSDMVEVEFDVTAADRNLLKIGQRVRIHVKDGDEVQGRVTQVSFAAKDESRLFSVYAEAPFRDNLYPGLLATVDVTVRERSGITAIPKDALLDRGKGPIVVVIKDGIANIRPVKTGLIGDENVEIVAGISPGEMVAVYGQREVEDGSKVKIVKE